MSETTHVRETAANLLLGRALRVLEGACGVVRFRDVEGRWVSDSFSLPGGVDHLDLVRPVLNALVDWTIHAEKPVVVSDLARSRWSRHLLQGAPPVGSMVATPLAQRGQIWGAAAIYRLQAVAEAMDLLRQLAEVATEPLSALDTGRPEGVQPER